MMRELAPFGIALAALLASRVGHASPTTKLVYVRGDGAESCPDEEALKQSVMAHLGYDPFRPFAPTSLFAEVRRDRDRLVGQLKIVDDAGIERGARTLDSRGDDCSELTAAMALSMSIAIDPRSALRGPAPPEPGEAPSAEREEEAPPAPAPALPAPPERAPPPTTEQPATPARREGARHAGVGAGVYGSLGEALGTTAGARGFGEVTGASWSAGVEVRAVLPTSLDIAGGGSVRTSLYGGALVACWRPAPLAVIPSVCGLGFIGRMQTRTVNVATPESRVFVHGSAGVRVAVDVTLAEGVLVRVALDAMGTLAPFVVEVDKRRVYESPAVSGTGGAALVYAF